MKDRVLMTYPASQLPFLPPLEDFLRLVGYGAGMAGLVRDLGLQQGKVPPSEKTLKAAFTKPVTRSTANRIKDILEAKISPAMDLERLEEMFKPWEDLRLASNGASWLPAIEGLRAQVLKNRFPETHTEKFLKDRIHQERLFLFELRPIALSSIRTKHDREIIENAVTGLLLKHTIVDKGLIETAKKLKQSDPEGPKTERQFYQEIRIDFYYRLLSALSLDIVERLNQLDVESVDTDEFVSKGIFGMIAPKIQKNGAVLYPFAQLLERWKSVFASKPDEPLTWRELSKAIPHPNDERMKKLDPASIEHKDLLTVSMQTRKTRLREWRSGVVPSEDQLIDFIRNLLPEGADGHYPWLIAQFSCSWGRLIDQELDRNESGESDYPVNEGLLFRYQDVWDDFRNQAANNVAT